MFQLAKLVDDTVFEKIAEVIHQASEDGFHGTKPNKSNLNHSIFNSLRQQSNSAFVREAMLEYLDALKSNKLGSADMQKAAYLIAHKHYLIFLVS